MICSRAAALRQASERLAAAGIEQPRREARLLLAHLLGLSTETLLHDLEQPVEWAPFAVLLARRLAREPLAFITGQREFWSLPLQVSNATLIPRPDTETLLEAALAELPDRHRVASVLDLGTGTGCLLLAALTEFPLAFGVGVDLSPEAVALARTNARSLRLAGRAGFLVGDWAAAIGATFGLILCNPPYIPSKAIATLMPEVAHYEPASALDGGTDGLDAYERLIPDLPRLMSPEGLAILEIGAGMHEPVITLAARSGLQARTRLDLAGIPRALVLRGRRAEKTFGSAARCG